VRDSPALEIVADLLQSGASIAAFDPAAMKKAQAALSDTQNLTFANNSYEACVGADALLVLTEWQEFYGLDLSLVKKLLRLPILVDGKNIFNPSHVEEAGLTYYGPTVAIASGDSGFGDVKDAVRDIDRSVCAGRLTAFLPKQDRWVASLAANAEGRY
jgi:hypothetical protein